MTKKLSNETFVNGAPAEVVADHRQRLVDWQERHATLCKALESPRLTETNTTMSSLDHLHIFIMAGGSGRALLADEPQQDAEASPAVAQ